MSHIPHDYSGSVWGATTILLVKFFTLTTVLNHTEVITTILLAAIGAVVGFVVQLILNFLKDKYNARDTSSSSKEHSRRS
jgi:predicted histidine transporter YuiF (NhaC family)